MFNKSLSIKENLVNYFKELYLWQHKENLQVNFELAQICFPVSLISFNEAFNTYFDNIVSIEDFNAQEQQTTEIESIQSSLDYSELLSGEASDLSLKMSASEKDISHFYFKNYQDDWFCIINTCNKFEIYYVFGQFRSINTNNIQNIYNFTQSLSAQPLSKSSSSSLDNDVF